MSYPYEAGPRCLMRGIDGERLDTNSVRTRPFPEQNVWRYARLEKVVRLVGTG